MAKSDNSTFGDFSKKINLSPDRQNLEPVNPKLSFEQYLFQCIQEGHALLNAEATSSVTKRNSVKSPEPLKQPPSILQDALAKSSPNPYVRARAEILGKMSPGARAAVEEMERIGNTCNSIYDKFAQSVTILGDKLSSNN